MPTTKQKPKPVSFDEDWTTCFGSFFLLSQELRLALRRAAGDALVRNGAEEVGGSDINHELYSEWKANNRDWNLVTVHYVNEAVANLV